MNTLARPSLAEPGVVVVMLMNYWPRHLLWGWMRLAAGPAGLKGVPGLLFAKVMGSGYGGSFSLRPSASHQGLICRFSREDLALDFVRGAQARAMLERVREFWCGILSVSSSRGSWDRQPWPLNPKPKQAAQSQPWAVLTRASIAPSKAVAFWRHAPATQSDLALAPDCLLGMGLGEAPLLRQCTFSLWRDPQAMRNYTTQGAHQRAAQAAYRHGVFSESLFVQMDVLQMSGRWRGQDFGDALGLRQEFAHA